MCSWLNPPKSTLFDWLVKWASRKITKCCSHQINQPSPIKKIMVFGWDLERPISYWVNDIKLKCTSGLGLEQNLSLTHPAHVCGFFFFWWGESEQLGIKMHGLDGVIVPISSLFGQLFFCCRLLQTKRKLT